MADIFISYTSSDREWAFWVGKELRELGHTPRIHDWEIKGGEDIYAWMEQRHDAADHVLCLLSDEYLRSPYTTLERNAALWQAAPRRPGFVLMVAVKPCKVPTLSDHIRRCDLYGLPQEAARQRFRDFMAVRSEPALAAFPGQAFAVSNIPIRVPKHFIGRVAALEAIERGMSQSAGRVAITALQGMRGVGKTTLAAAYADKHRQAYRATWWIRAETAAGMRADLVALGVRLQWVAPDEKEGPALAAVLERLRHDSDGILLIYDNAIDGTAIEPFLPSGGRARIIVTSNFHAWRGIAEPIEIRTWPKEIGAEYLITRTGRTQEEAAAQTLSALLGGLPLAHEQAAAYCERLDVPLGDYIRRFEKTPARILDDSRHAPSHYHDGLSVGKTFAIAIEESGKLHAGAEPLIVHASFLAPEPLPLFVFSEALGALGEPLASLLEEDGLAEAVAALRAFALIDRETIADERQPELTTPTIRLHRLVRAVASMRRPAEQGAAVRASLVKAMASIYPDRAYDDPGSWARCRRLDSHVLALVGDDAPLVPEVVSQTAELINGVASYRHGALAAFAPARRLHDRALAMCETHLGPDHPETATSLNNLALLLRDEGDFDAARPMLERALAIRERALQPDDPETGLSLNNLAVLHQDRGDLVAARPLLERALAIKEKTLGSDDFETMLSRQNLAVLLVDQGDLATARPLFELALAGFEKLVGRESPHTATSLNALAGLLQAQGDTAGARPLFERALAICETRLGPEHPDTATTLNDLALLLQAQGDLASAGALFERALAICEKVLGADHPYTGTSLNNLARLMRDRGDYAEAQPLFERALAIYEKAHGSEHPATGRVGSNFAEMFVRSGDPARGVALGEAALATHEQALGPAHAWTLDTARITARALDALGRDAAAKALRERLGIT